MMSASGHHHRPLSEDGYLEYEQRSRPRQFTYVAEGLRVFKALRLLFVLVMCL